MHILIAHTIILLTTGLRRDLLESLLAALKAAAEPTRLRLLNLCAHSDLTVTDLTRILGQSQPRISRHLKLLCEARLLERLSEGSWAYFRAARQSAVADFSGRLVDALPADDPMIRADLERLTEILREREALAAEYFNRNARRWNELRSRYIDEAEVERELVTRLSDGQGGALLDIGTGTGRMLEVLGPLVESALGIDLSHEMLVVARATLARAGLSNCRVRQADMYQLPLADRSIDAAVLHQVLHYAARPAQALKEGARVLRSGGKLVVVDFEHHGRETRFRPGCKKPILPRKARRS
jgi:ArsR family transcriptional regulator